MSKAARDCCGFLRVPGHLGRNTTWARLSTSDRHLGDLTWYVPSPAIPVHCAQTPTCLHVTWQIPETHRVLHPGSGPGVSHAPANPGGTAGVGELGLHLTNRLAALFPAHNSWEDSVPSETGAPRPQLPEAPTVYFHAAPPWHSADSPRAAGEHLQPPSLGFFLLPLLGLFFKDSPG